jgi:hypothetical protein
VFFRHEFPHELSDLRDPRKRLGNRLEFLLAESLTKPARYGRAI